MSTAVEDVKLAALEARIAEVEESIELGARLLLQLPQAAAAGLVSVEQAPRWVAFGGRIIEDAAKRLAAVIVDATREPGLAEAWLARYGAATCAIAE